MTIRDEVKYYLINHKKARDNDNLLCAIIWDHEILIKGIPKIDFLFEYADGVFTSAETIVRHRRKLQELNPELRGEKYNLRITKLEAKKREEFSPKNNK